MPWSLRHSYTLLSPIYDLVADRAFRAARARSLRVLPTAGADVLIDGIGSGLDLAFLPSGNRYTGVDITRAMLRRAQSRSRATSLELIEGDSMNLPFRDGSFDCVLLHLILAVVPDSSLCLHEAARVTRRGGRLVVLDKFLHAGKRAVLRRALNGVARRIATRTDVVFEEALSACPELRVLSDEPAMLGGWIRHIVLEKG